MVYFVLGRAGSGKSAFVRERILSSLAEGKPAVLLVPEQQTVVWETRMAEAVPDSRSLGLEITNFTRLANSVFRECGGLASPVLDEGSRLLLTWRAMVSVWDSLRVYGGESGAADGSAVHRAEIRRTEIRREDRAVLPLLSAIDDFKASGISPSQAEEALLALRNREEAEANPGHSVSAERTGSLGDRLSDAALVYAAYEELLHRSAMDRCDLLRKLADTLDAHPYFRGKRVFVDSFFSLTAPEEGLLLRILRQADDVTVTFPCPPDDPADGADSGELTFGETRAFLKTAMRLAARAGREYEKIPLRGNYRHRNAPDLAAVERFLFRYSEELPEMPEVPEPPEAESASDPVRVLGCADLFDEAEACASLIDRLIREDGYRYSDIAVVARDMKTREGLLDSTLRRHGIPCFLSESSSVSTSPAVRLILSALRVIGGGWRREDILALMKTGLTPVNAPPEAEEADSDSAEADSLLPGDVFELYTETWNLDGRRLYTSEWRMNPDGYQRVFTERGKRLLALANRARERLIPPLNRLAEVFDGGAAPVRETAEALVHLAQAYDLPRQTEETARSYEKIGMPADAEKLRQSWRAVCSVLDKMVSLLGELSLDPGRFAGLFRKTAGQLDVGSIPTSADEVVLGSSSGVRFDEVKCVILLGVKEGEFPAALSDNRSFFGERDREALAAVGLELAVPDSALLTARESFMFYRTAASASEKLFLLAPVGKAASDFSEGARRVVRILESRGRNPLAFFGSLPLSEIVYHPASAEYLLARRPDPADQTLLRSLVGEDRLPAVPLSAEEDRVSPRSGRSDSAGKPLALSQSQMEAFSSCPFRYACQYRLRIEPPPRAQLGAADVGTFVHYVLERFFAALPPEKRDALPLPEEETERLADSVIGEFVKELADASGDSAGLEDGRLRYLLRRLRRHVLVFLEAIMRELAQSRFRPAALELPIGDGRPGSVPALRFPIGGGGEVMLRGVADRVDRWKTDDGREYLRVVDYKTGAKTFSMKNVAEGLDVQLLLYLFSVWQYGVPEESRAPTEGVRIPAGAVYFSIRPNAVSSPTLLSAEEARELALDGIERTGVYLADEEALDAMDRGLSGTYVPVTRKASGELGAPRSLSTCLLTAEEFGALREQLGETVGKIARALAEGHAEAAPRPVGGRLPCEWCANAVICRRM